MNYLLVMAHPDDVVFGAGATVRKLAAEGNKVDVLIMCSCAEARSARPDDEEFSREMKASQTLLGVEKVYLGLFPNIKMNTIPHLELVQFIEKAIATSKPDILITHHPSDVNDDHKQTAAACQEAFRLFQRKSDVKPISEFWYTETLSCTEWALDNGADKFNPNTFIEIGEDGVKFKTEAGQIYKGVMRPYPHPRSQECIAGLAAYRGSQSGLNYAEAFECVFRRIKSGSL